MKQGRERRQNTQKYQFIQETIKKNPGEGKNRACQILMIAGSGMLFGSCAAAAFAGAFPILAEREEDTQQKIELTESTAMEKTESVTGEGTVEEESESTLSDTENGTLTLYEETYKEVLKIAQEPQKSIVNVRGISKDEDLLDNSYMQQEDSEGLIFLETDTQFYILTYEKELENLQKLQITFSDGSIVSGEICGGDVDTGFAVAAVDKSLLSESTRKDIVVSDLTESQSPEQSDMVIAIGEPAGDRNAVAYGMVTSVSEKLLAADTEYEILATDMQGSEEGSGVLLDTSGNIAGMILKEDESDGDNIHAISISQILPLVERLANGEKARYTGLYGIELEQAQCSQTGIGAGIYVEHTETDSPAMKAGIQSGDIITGIDGNETEGMLAYYTYLQTKKVGDKITLTVMRRNSGGVYVKKDYEISVEEKY